MPRGRASRGAVPPAVLIYDYDVGETSAKLLLADLLQRRVHVLLASASQHARNLALVKSASKHIVLVTRDVFKNGAGNSQELLEELSATQLGAVVFTHETHVAAGAPTKGRSKEVCVEEMVRRCSEKLEGVFDPASSVPFSRDRPVRIHAVDRVMAKCNWNVRELFYHPRMLLHRRIRSCWKRLSVKKYGYKALLTKSKEHVEQMEEWVKSRGEESVLIFRCDNEAKSTALLKDTYNLAQIHNCVTTQYYFDAQSFSTRSTRMWILSMMAQVSRANPNDLYAKLCEEMRIMDLRSSFDYLSFGEQALMLLVDFVRRMNLAYSIGGRNVINIVGGLEHLPQKEAECFIHIIRCYWSRFLPSYYRIAVVVNSAQYEQIIDMENIDPLTIEIPLEGLDAAELRHVVKQFIETSEYCQMDLGSARERAQSCEDLSAFARIFRSVALKLVGFEEYSRVLSAIIAAREPLSSKYFDDNSQESFSKLLPFLSVILRIDYEELVEGNDHALLSFKSQRLRQSFLAIEPELEGMGHAHLADWALKMSELDLYAKDVGEDDCAVVDVLMEFALCNLIFHLCHSARFHEVHVKMVNLKWLLRAISSIPVSQVLADMDPFGELDTRKRENRSTEVFVMFERVRRILRMTKDVLLLQPLEVVAQLEAKLLGGNDLGEQILVDTKSHRFYVPRLAPLKPFFDEEAGRNLLYKRVTGTPVLTIAAVPHGRHFYVSCEHVPDVFQYDAFDRTEAFVVRTLPIEDKPVVSMVTTKRYDRLITATGREGFIMWSVTGDGLFLSTTLNGPVEQMELSCNDVNLFLLSGGGRWVTCFSTDSPDEAKWEVRSDEVPTRVTKVICCDALDEGVVYLGYSDGSVGYISENSVRRLSFSLGACVYSMITAVSGEVVNLIVGMDSGDCVIINTETSDIVNRVHGHIGPVLSITAVHDRFVTGACDGYVKVWNEQFEQSAIVGKHDAPVSAVGVLYGEKIVSGGRDGYINVWTLPPLEAPREDANEDVTLAVSQQHTNTITCVSMSPDGQLVGSTSFDKKVLVRSLQNGNVVFQRLETSPTYCCLFSRCSTRFVYASSGGKVVVFDIERTANGFDFNEAGNYSHMYGVWTLSFSQDALMLASSGADCRLQVWSIGAGRDMFKLLEEDCHGAPVNSVAFAPSMKLFASSSHKPSKTVAFWEYEYDVEDPENSTFTCAKIFSESSFHGYVATLIAFSPNENMFVASCEEPDVRKQAKDDRVYFIVLQATPPYRPMRTISSNVCLSTYFLSFDTTSKYFAAAGYDTKTVHFYHINNGVMVEVENEVKDTELAMNSNACVNCAQQGLHANTFCYNQVAEPSSDFGVGFSTYKSGVVAGPTPKRHLAMVTSDKSRVVVQERFNVAVLQSVPRKGE